MEMWDFFVLRQGLLIADEVEWGEHISYSVNDTFP
jgi:hypothetical protein